MQGVQGVHDRIRALWAPVEGARSRAAKADMCAAHVISDDTRARGAKLLIRREERRDAPIPLVWTGRVAQEGRPAKADLAVRKEPEAPASPDRWEMIEWAHHGRDRSVGVHVAAADMRLLHVRQLQRRLDCQVPTRRHPRDDELTARSVACLQSARGVDAVVNGTWPHILGRAPILDTDCRRPESSSKVARENVLTDRAAEEQAAAVRPHDEWSVGRHGRRLMHADGYSSVGVARRERRVSAGHTGATGNTREGHEDLGHSEEKDEEGPLDSVEDADDRCRLEAQQEGADHEALDCGKHDQKLVQGNQLAPTRRRRGLDESRGRHQKGAIARPPTRGAQLRHNSRGGDNMYGPWCSYDLGTST